LEKLAFSIFHPEDVGSRFLQKAITTYQTDYMAS
jgi:hypothetical protein